MYGDYKRYIIKSSAWKNVFDLDDHGVMNLFSLYSKRQQKFRLELNKYQLEIGGTQVIESIDQIEQEFEELGRIYPDLFNSSQRKVRAKLDFDIAEIYHRNLKLPKRIQVEYGFWRYLTLNHLMEHVHWRWRPDKEQEVLATVNALFNRSVSPKYPKRINALRYWLIGERLFDKEHGYSLLHTIAKRSKEHEGGAYQDYINNIIDNKMLSPEDTVSKELATIMFDRKDPFVTKKVIGSFKRFNAYKLRDYRLTDRKILEKEICHI